MDTPWISIRQTIRAICPLYDYTINVSLWAKSLAQEHTLSTWAYIHIALGGRLNLALLKFTFPFL